MYYSNYIKSPPLRLFFLKKKKIKSLSTQAVNEIFHLHKKYSALSRKLTQAHHSALYEDLKEYGQFTGLCRLISPEPPLPTIEESIFSDKFLEATGRQQQLDCLARHSRFQDTDTLSISDLTVGWRENPAWFFPKRACPTASNFGFVL